MEDSLFAYSMSQSEQGWSWRLWDETGDVVAAGDAPDQTSAYRRLLEAYERTREAAAAKREETSDVDGLELPAAPTAKAPLAGRRRIAAPSHAGARLAT